MQRIYLDYAATTPPHPEVVEAMQPYLTEKFGNPSSLHSFGQEARKAVEEARAKVADLIKARPKEIVFTSGGTESNNFALFGTLSANKEKRNHIITSKIEHHAILEPCRYLEKNGFEVTYLDVDKDGIINPEDVIKATTDKTALVSIMHANNEIGSIQPIREIGQFTGKKGIYLHSDAVQTVGEIDISVNNLWVDLLSASGHKFYGPKGVGFLFIRSGTKMHKYLFGGEQEKNRRASTENVAGIVGLGKACEIAQKELFNWTTDHTIMRNKLIKGLFNKIPDIQLNGHPEKRLPKNADFTIKYVEGEAMLLKLDLEGIAVSTGSACSSGTLEPSHVLTAIGVSPEDAHGSIRFSLGRLTKPEELDHVINIFPDIVKNLRKMSPLSGRK
ncbi:cysteine desulfurase NifS [Candidatus Margulisiibacteriota bacterium]